MDCRWQKNRVPREGVVTGLRGPTVTSKLWTGTASTGMAPTAVARQTASTNTYSVLPPRPDLIYEVELSRQPKLVN